MRKWCATVAMGALLALPLCAQQKDASTASNTNGTTESTATANATTSDFSIAPASSTLFAMPAAAAAKPADIYSDWDNNPWNRHAWGLLTPKFEVAGLFQYVNFCPCSFQQLQQLWRDRFVHLQRQQVVGPDGGNWRISLSSGRSMGRRLRTGAYTLETTSGSFQSYLFGPRVNFRHFDHFVPFVEVLFGAAHAGSQLTGTSSQSSFALAAGGGVDVVLFKNFAWRFFEADYLMTNFTGSLVSPEGRQNNFRIGTGVVLRWGYPPEPPKPIHPPDSGLLCKPDFGVPGLDGASHDSRGRTDADKIGLTYSYTATGGTVDGTGPGCTLEPVRTWRSVPTRSTQGGQRPWWHGNVRRRRGRQQASEPAASDFLRAGTQPDHRRRTRGDQLDRERSGRRSTHLQLLDNGWPGFWQRPDGAV